MKRLLLGALLLLTPAASTAAESARVGDPAPYFTLPDLFGRTISLDYFDGHPGVVLFWSSGSPQSTELLDDSRGYQERWSTDGLAIVAVNVDGGEPGASQLQTARDWADRLDIVYPVLLDHGHAVLSAYGVDALPTAVVIDAGGRISAVLQGSAAAIRDRLNQSILAAMAGTSRESSTAAAGSSCGISRARSCTHIDERDPSAANPAVMAVRLCVCHGDTAAAQIMLSAISKQGTIGPDLRFALAQMMLVKGSTAEARRAFENLREHYPGEGWGEWGLGIVALTEGDAESALTHLRAARTGGWSIPEVETAVLNYLEGYWRTKRTAPQEEQFLALFAGLHSVRVCYRKLNERG